MDRVGKWKERVGNPSFQPALEVYSLYTGGLISPLGQRGAPKEHFQVLSQHSFKTSFIFIKKSWIRRGTKLFWLGLVGCESTHKIDPSSVFGIWCLLIPTIFLLWIFLRLSYQITGHTPSNNVDPPELHDPWESQKDFKHETDLSCVFLLALIAVLVLTVILLLVKTEHKGELQLFSTDLWSRWLWVGGHSCLS